MFFGRNDPDAETPVPWPAHAMYLLTLKDSDAGKDWGHEKTGSTKDDMP